MRSSFRTLSQHITFYSGTTGAVVPVHRLRLEPGLRPAPEEFLFLWAVFGAASTPLRYKTPHINMLLSKTPKVFLSTSLECPAFCPGNSPGVEVFCEKLSANYILYILIVLLFTNFISVSISQSVSFSKTICQAMARSEGNHNGYRPHIKCEPRNAESVNQHIPTLDFVPGRPTQ